MKHYTPEYIELCEDEKIQGLRVNKKVKTNRLLINKRDFFCSKHDKDIEVAFIGYGVSEKYYLWIPRGDQLDDEIAGIRNKNYAIYDITFSVFATNSGNIEGCRVIYKDIPKDLEIEEVNSNPLIAKIKLLKELLNAN